MTPNHKQFIEAIREKKKGCVRFYSKADSGVIDLVCAPMDYGPGAGIQDGVNRYWLWDYTSNTGSPALGLLLEQVLDLRVLGEVFDTAEFGVPPPAWSIPRDCGSPSGSGTEIRTGEKFAPEGRPVNQKQPTPLAADSCSRLTKTK
jgi:hypothetical protein